MDRPSPKAHIPDFSPCCKANEHIYRGRKRNGSTVLIGICTQCHKYRELPKGILNPKDWERLSWYYDHACKNCDGTGCDWCAEQGCRVCGSLEQIEHHHWLPQVLNQRNKHDQWAHITDLLCRTCHIEWHRTVTPGLMK